MSVENLVFATLKALVDNRVYRDIAPEKLPDETVTPTPRITFQQAGGEAVNFLDGSAPSKKNARIQVNTWHDSRDQANALGRDVEDAMRSISTVLSAAVSVHEPETNLFGTIQDFSVWYDD